MIGGGRMSKYNYQSRSSSSSSMFNGDVRVLECWCPRICAIRKTNIVKNSEKVFLCLPSAKGLFNHHCVMSEWFVWVDEAEELGYFKKQWNWCWSWKKDKIN